MTSAIRDPDDHTDEPDHRRGRVRSREWRRVARGLHVRVDAIDPVRSELRAWQSLLPSTACFTGFTAARLRGWDLPALPGDTPVCVSAREDDRHPIHGGLLVTRHREAPR